MMVPDIYKDIVLKINSNVNCYKNLNYCSVFQKKTVILQPKEIKTKAL